MRSKQPLERDVILDEIKRFAAETGQAPGMNAFRHATGIRIEDWQGRYWARWSDAVREAGLTPNALQSSYPRETLLRALLNLTHRLGHLPTRAEFDLDRRSRSSGPTFTALSRALGLRQVARAQALLDYCATQPGFDDVREICLARLGSAKPHGKRAAEETSSLGEVYLFRSGRHYKIGRSNSSGRRERELALLMPDKGEVVHAIKTDDPAGIELYWHRRFEVKRRGGEWFDLTAADVSAFKRRRFM